MFGMEKERHILGMGRSTSVIIFMMSEMVWASMFTLMVIFMSKAVYLPHVRVLSITER